MLKSAIHFWTFVTFISSYVENCTATPVKLFPACSISSCLEVIRSGIYTCWEWMVQYMLHWYCLSVASVISVQSKCCNKRVNRNCTVVYTIVHYYTFGLTCNIVFVSMHCMHHCTYTFCDISKAIFKPLRYVISMSLSYCSKLHGLPYLCCSCHKGPVFTNIKVGTFSSISSQNAWYLGILCLNKPLCV